MIKKFCSIPVFVILCGSYELVAMSATEFEERLRQPDTQQVLQAAAALAAQYDLPIDFLKGYYNILQFLAIKIIEITHASNKVELHSKITAAINPGTAQIEPGCVAVEFHKGIPRGFWSPLGFVPICECGPVYDDEAVKKAWDTILNFLALKHVKDLGHGDSLWRGHCTLSNPIERGQSPALQERKQAIPYADAEAMWRAVKPTERADFWQ